MSPALTTALGLLLPFAGTAAGSACVFLLRRSLRLSVHRFLLGFATGVMTAASVFSLLLPAIEASAGMGRLAFVPAAVGTLLGLLFLPAIRAVTPTQAEAAPVSARRRAALLCLAVTIHNIPEGMAPGVAFAGALNGGGVSMAAAWSLALGIAIQNFCLQNTQDASSIHIGRELGRVEANLHVALGGQIVYLIRLNLIYHLHQAHGVTHIAIMQMEVWLTFEMSNTLTEIYRRTTDDAMYFITLLQKELREV